MSSRGLTVALDPHVHTDASYDGREPVELVLEQAAAIGLDAIAVTDHDVIHASLEAAERAADYGIVAIPGVEISTAHGHLLALGVEEMPPAGQPFVETVEAVRDLGGVAVVPHPFQRTRHGVRKRHLTDADAVEIYNAWLFTGYRNRRARTFADRRGYPGVAGSDAHTLGSIGRAYTEVTFPEGTSRADVDADAIVDAIRKGATHVQGRRAPVHRAAGHYGKAMGRKSAWAARRAPGAVASSVSLFRRALL